MVAQKMNAQYMECSSKEMKGVEEIFERAILTVVANDRKTMEQEAKDAGSEHGGGKKSRGRSGTVAGGVGVGGAYGPIPIVKKKKRRCAMV